MPRRRILSLWFPRLAAERLLRQGQGLPPGPFAVVEERGNMQVLGAMSPEAEAAGLRPGQALRDAHAICPGLVTRIANPVAEAAFLGLVRRWTGKFSPWVAEEPPAALILDITGCAHLFGGEAAMAEKVTRDCATLGLSVQAGIADTVGAAWALARFAGAGIAGGPGGDAIEQEARATRSRAAKTKRRHWTRGGAAPRFAPPRAPEARIAPVGATRGAIAPLPLAALRLAPEQIEALARLGLRRIEDILGTPRAGLARRFGPSLVRRLDQALGIEPEPVSPARPPIGFTVRMSFPEPIGTDADFLAALDRLLPALAQRLAARGHGARRVRMEFSRVDDTAQAIEVGLARPGADPDRIRPLLAMKFGDVDPGFGIDMIRLAAPLSEPLPPLQHRGPVGADTGALAETGAAVADLMGRLGARLGLEAMYRLHPGDSHAPEKAEVAMAAAFSDPCPDWPAPPAARPLRLWRPEIVHAREDPALPGRFRWRGREHEVAAARGPQRIAPEWWLDEPDWRTGARDYWEVVTRGGDRLWLYYAHGGSLSGGWFCHGAFG